MFLQLKHLLIEYLYHLSEQKQKLNRPQCLESNPNILGLAQYSFGGYTDDSTAVFNGALYAEPDNKKAGATNGQSMMNGHPGFGFDASKSDDIYSGNGLQPSALSVLICIKL